MNVRNYDLHYIFFLSIIDEDAIRTIFNEMKER